MADDLDKVAKLIRLLASDKEGEVLATVSALRRVLSRAGRTFNDLANLVENPNIAKAAASAPKENWYVQYGNEILTKAHDRLKDRELKFVKDIIVRFNINPRYEMSEKQAKWLAFIYQYYVIEGNEEGL